MGGSLELVAWQARRPGYRTMNDFRLEHPVARRPFHREIGYSNCWEDPLILLEALNIQPGEHVFSITSGGCNTLSLLVADPGRVVALDFNPNQNHLLALKIEAFRKLSHAEVLDFLGVRPNRDRLALYRRLRPGLDVRARAFWDGHTRAIARGVISCGRLERYLLGFGRVMRLIYGKRRLADAFALGSLEAQTHFHDSVIDGPLWRWVFDVFFSRAVMSRAKDREHFRQVASTRFGAIFRARARRALTDIPLETNPYLALIMLGHHLGDDSLPLYLQERHFKTIRERADRIEIVTAPIDHYLESVATGTFDAFNCSNLFDWLDPQAFVSIHRQIVHAARPGARMANWSTLLERPIPIEEVPELTCDMERSRDLLTRDRAFLYANFQVGHVRRAGSVQTIPNHHLV
jgi:S-adenosylmethionine-diacylglycerol 3-amino-3-carboxypropyl transferase